MPETSPSAYTPLSIEDRVAILLEEKFSSFSERYVTSYDEVSQIAEELRRQGKKIVLTSGSFDILHEGHSMYLEAARDYGQFLVVGVDSDEKIRRRKGPGRPAVPEIERLRMVAHQRGVGMVVLKRVDDPKWALIRALQPDVLVATEETYSASEIKRLEGEYCGRVEVLGRMATVSTSARLRLIQLRLAEDVAARLSARLPDLFAEIVGEVTEPSPQS